jgi:hypothetical protein
VIKFGKEDRANVPSFPPAAKPMAFTFKTWGGLLSGSELFLEGPLSRARPFALLVALIAGGAILRLLGSPK